MWARAVVAAYRDYAADRVVAETNQGGDLVLAVIRQVDENVPVRRRQGHARQVAARRARLRALCAGPRLPRRRVAGAGGADVRLRPRRPRRSGKSPDRLDALVWAIDRADADEEARTGRVAAVMLSWVRSVKFCQCWIAAVLLNLLTLSSDLVRGSISPRIRLLQWRMDLPALDAGTSPRMTPWRSCIAPISSLCAFSGEPHPQSQSPRTVRTAGRTYSLLNNSRRHAPLFPRAQAWPDASRAGSASGSIRTKRRGRSNVRCSSRECGRSCCRGRAPWLQAD